MLDYRSTTFAIVASVAGARLPLEVMILTGFAKLLGDGMAMGLGDCLSEGAEQDHIRGERKREAWEMANVSVRGCARGRLQVASLDASLVP